MMEFIKNDFNNGKITIENGGKYEPDYQGAIAISTKASLKYMIAPGALVIISPLLAGLLFGPSAVEGLLAGAIVSGVQVAISASNTGGAWDNCKKEIEKERSAFKTQMKKEGIDIAALSEKIANTPEGDLKNVLKSHLAASKRLKALHDAAVVGDTVGDPLKDTSGPAINILIKLSAITSLVFGSFIKEYYLIGNDGK
jgi:Na+/H+-translocating membrane pyrophosphatase